MKTTDLLKAACVVAVCAAAGSGFVSWIGPFGLLLGVPLCWVVGRTAARGIWGGR